MTVSPIESKATVYESWVETFFWPAQAPAIEETATFYRLTLDYLRVQRRMLGLRRRVYFRVWGPASRVAAFQDCMRLWYCEEERERVQTEYERVRSMRPPPA